MLESSPDAVFLPGQGSQVPSLGSAQAGARPDLLEAVTGLVGGPTSPRVDEPARLAAPANPCAAPAGWSIVSDRIEQPLAAAL